MKITKLRQGMRVQCSDSEFLALSRLAVIGLRTPAADREANLSSSAKAAMRSERFSSGAGPLGVIDETRR